MGRISDAILNALFPRACVGCRRLGALLCVECQQQDALGQIPQATEEHFACAWYSTPAVRRLIESWKFQGDLSAEEVMHCRIVECQKELRNWVVWGSEGDEIPVLVPAPLTRRRFAERGFNQAERFAHIVAQSTGLPVQKCFIRRGRNAHLAHLTTTEDRQQAMEQQYITVQGVAPRSVILIDDVRTSGTTLSALTRALQQAGTQRIRSLTFALSHEVHS